MTDTGRREVGPEATVSGREVALGRDRIAQIIANLLDNASKHTAAGGRVTIRVRCREDRAIFDVIDEGVGIPPDHLERVFELFAQIQRR